MKKLDRELGLLSVISIACGAMISGLLVLPGYTAYITGASAYLAFLLAGLLFVPATLSKSEMTTAVPEAGGDYLFIDRSLGPVFSTISGIGMFLTFILKAAFALAGMAAYLFLLVPFSSRYAPVFAAVVALGLAVLNYRGVKKAGQLQTVLIVVTGIVLSAFLVRGSTQVHTELFTPFFKEGWKGFFTATAFVFVSYAGVTKVASVAEEVKDPGRIIPIGMLFSLVLMILFYTAVVYVTVGTVPVSELVSAQFKNAPLGVVGLKILGPLGEWLMAGMSVLALTAMANAGLMASSRYPLALARQNQLPGIFERVHPEFSTPSAAVMITGALLIVSILFLPVIQLAKLASTFKLLVLAFFNLALIILRESDIEWYQPEFRSPLYPYIQIVGIVSCLGLIGFLGITPLLSALALILGGAGWYFLYVRDRVDRKGALFQSPVVEEEIKLFREARTKSSSHGPDKDSVIVPFFGLEDADMMQVERRIRLAASLCTQGERLDVVDFMEVPEQSFLADFEPDLELFETLERRARLIGNTIENEIHVDQVITHNARGALKNYAEEENPHWVIFGWKEPSPWKFLIGTSEWWLEDFPCDRLFFQDRGREKFEDILVWTHPGPYDGEVVYAADHIARYDRGEVTFLQPIVSRDNRGFPLDESYIKELESLCLAPSGSHRIPIEEWVEGVLEATAEADLLVLGGLHHPIYEELDFEELEAQIVEEAHCSVARVESGLHSPQSLRRRHEPLSIDLSDYLAEDPVLLDSSVGDKDRLFQEVAKLMADGRMTSQLLEEAFWEREEKHNTFLEKGFAFPHAISEHLSGTRCQVVVLDNPVEYTPEGDRVQYLIPVVGPPEDRQTHLEIIGAMADLLITSDGYGEDPMEGITERLHAFR